MILNLFLFIINSERVLIGSWSHILPISFAVLFAYFIYKIALDRNEGTKWRIVNAIAIFISAFVILFHLHKLITEDYDIAKDLPLYLCSLLGIVIPVFTYYKKYWMFEILVFWIIAGTIQAVITPDIKQDFPSFEYFRYWTVHLGLLTVIFYIIIVFKWKPKFKSIFKSFFALQVYVLLMILINYLLSSNYFYLNEKPQTATLLDYFGPWPWYIVTVQLILIPYFMLIYLPFYLLNRKKRTETT